MCVYGVVWCRVVCRIMCYLCVGSSVGDRGWGGNGSVRVCVMDGHGAQRGRETSGGKERGAETEEGCSRPPAQPIDE